MTDLRWKLNKVQSGLIQKRQVSMELTETEIRSQTEIQWAGAELRILLKFQLKLRSKVKHCIFSYQNLFSILPHLPFTSAVLPQALSLYSFAFIGKMNQLSYVNYIIFWINDISYFHCSTVPSAQPGVEGAGYGKNTFSQPFMKNTFHQFAIYIAVNMLQNQQELSFDWYFLGTDFDQLG